MTGVTDSPGGTPAGGSEGVSGTIVAGLVAAIGALMSFVQDNATPLLVALLAAATAVGAPFLSAAVPQVLGMVECLRRSDRRELRQRFRGRIEALGGNEQAGELLGLSGLALPAASTPRMDVGRTSALAVSVRSAADTAERASRSESPPPVLLNRWLCRGAQALLYESAIRGERNEALCGRLEKVPPDAGLRDLQPMVGAHRALAAWRAGERAEAEKGFTDALAGRPRRRLEAEILTNYGLFHLDPFLRYAGRDARRALTGQERDKVEEIAAQLEQALARWPRREHAGRATAALGLGAAFLVLGNLQQATDLLERARDTFDRLGRSEAVAVATHNLELR